MTKSQAMALSVATFVVALGLCAVLFAVLDVKTIYLVGPAIAIGAGSLGAYRAALDDRTTG